MAWGAEIAQYFIDEASSLIKGVNMKSMFAAYVEDQVEGALCLGALSVCPRYVGDVGVMTEEDRTTY